MAELPDLAGRTALITGATNGIGRATAHALAGAGARLYLLCRSAERGEETRREIAERTGNASLELLLCDLASQAQIRRAAAEFLAKGEPLHLLVNNAGVMNASRQETSDGIEATFAVNHLAYFLLTSLLLERLRQSAPARIVNVASDAHRYGGALDFDDLESRRRYGPMAVYGRSKTANLLFTQELARRLEGSGVTVNAVHPGPVSSGLGMQNDVWYRGPVRVLGRLFFRTPEKGAETSIWAATAPELDGVSGAYFADCRPAEPRPYARDSEAARRLWEVSEHMIG